MILSLVVQPSTHQIFAAVEARKDDGLRLLEDNLRELFEARGADDPAVEEVLLRSVLEGVLYKAAVYGAQYPVEQVRRRLYRMYDLPEPASTLSGTEPAPSVASGPSTAASRACPAVHGCRRAPR